MSTVQEIIGNREQLEESLSVIKRSFATVALALNLSPENAPTHAAFLTIEKLQELQRKAIFFGLFIDGKQVGFAAEERSEVGIYYLDKLAILPGQRYHGYGSKLLNYVIDHVKQQGGNKIALGMIDGMTALKEWYKRFGFKETGTKRFEHLPFLVCFMEKYLSA